MNQSVSNLFKNLDSYRPSVTQKQNIEQRK